MTRWHGGVGQFCDAVHKNPYVKWYTKVNYYNSVSTRLSFTMMVMLQKVAVTTDCFLKTDFNSVDTVLSK